MSAGNHRGQPDVLCVWVIILVSEADIQMDMAATTTRLGVDHPTVVPRGRQRHQDGADTQDGSAGDDGASA